MDQAFVAGIAIGISIATMYWVAILLLKADDDD